MELPPDLVACPLCGRSDGGPCKLSTELPRWPLGVVRDGIVTLFFAGSRRILVARPRPAGFGNLLMDLLVVLHVAAATEARLVLLRSPGVPNDAVLSVVGERLRIVRARRWTRIAGAALARVDRLARRGEALLDAPQARPRLPLGERWQAAAAAAESRRRRAERDADYFGLTPHLRELWAHHPVPVRLPRELAARAERAAATVGIDAEASLVVLHVRESGWWPARGREEWTNARVRSASIDSYDLAVDDLVSEGFAVVRIGDPTMTPYGRRGVVDLATSPLRSDLLELWCVLRSSFLVTTASGPYAYGWLAQKPSLGTNVITGPIGAYPIRRCDRYILKPIVDRRRGSTLSLAELSTLRYMEKRPITGDYGFVDNTPEEIRDAVAEMVEIVRGEARVVREQLEFRSRLVEVITSDDRRSVRMRKGRPAVYVGAGLVGRGFAERYFSLGREVPPVVEPV